MRPHMLHVVGAIRPGDIHKLVAYAVVHVAGGADTPHVAKVIGVNLLQVPGDEVPELSGGFWTQAGSDTSEVCVGLTPVTYSLCLGRKSRKQKLWGTWGKALNIRC